MARSIGAKNTYEGDGLSSHPYPFILLCYLYLLGSMATKNGVEYALKRIASVHGITKTNAKLAAEYANRLEVLGRNPKTTQKHLLYLRKVLEIKPGFNFAKATREDIEELMLKFGRQGNPSPAVIYDFKKVLKFFFKEMFMDGLGYPKCVLWLKLNQGRNKLMPSDILNQEEVLRMIDCATSSRDKALIALGFDSGIRSGELCSMKKKDIDLTSDPAHVVIDGKTGIRQVPVFFSVPYLARYLDDMKTLAPDDFVWRNLAQSHIRGAISAFGVNKMLRQVAKQAGIGKHVYWHLLRHSRASDYANKLTEQQLKAFFGWTRSSNMAATYVHLSGRDIDLAAKKANGIEIKEQETKPLLSSVECPRCKAINGKDARYCIRCGSVMNLQIALSEGRMRNLALAGSVNPEELKEFALAFNAWKKSKSQRKS